MFQHKVILYVERIKGMSVWGKLDSSLIIWWIKQNKIKVDFISSPVSVITKFENGFQEIMK